MRGLRRRFAAVACLLLAACLPGGAGETTATAPRQLFLPGARGEASAWLMAGPFEEAVERLEDPAAWKEVRAGSDAASGTTWRLLHAPGGQASPADPGAGSAPGVYYLLTGFALSCEQRGLLVAVGESAFTLFDPQGRAASDDPGRPRPGEVVLERTFAKGLNPVLLRIDAAKAPGRFALVGLALRNGRPERLRGLATALPGPPLGEARLRELLGRTASFGLRDAFPRGDSAELRLRLGPGAPLPARESVVEILLANPSTAEPRALGSLARLTPAKLRDGLALELPVGGLSGETRLLARFDGRADYVLETRFYPRDELGRLVDSWRERLERAEREAGAPFALCRYHLLFLEEALTDAPRSAQSYTPKRFSGTALAERLRRLEADWKAYASGADPLAGRSGLVEGAFVSQIDGSVQPFRLYLPERISRRDARTGAMPLAVLYHGYVPEYSRTDWMTIDEGMRRALDEAGMPLLLPFGRSNTDFLNVGEADLFEALDAVGKRYPLDPARLYLLGFSMGGSGVWTTLAHHPGRFAAAHIWSGRTDYYFWHDLDRQALPPWMRLLIDTDNPVQLAENVAAVPLVVEHPLSDRLVKVGHSQRMESALRRIAPPAPGEAAMQTFRYPADGSHWAFSSGLRDPATYSALLEHRLETAPERIELAAYTPRYARDRWLRIERFAKIGPPARLTVRFDAAAKGLRLEHAENVEAFSVHSSALGLEAHEPTLLSAPLGDAGATYPERSVGEGGWVRFAASPAPETFPPAKSPRVCGPVKDLFTRPFLVVRGTLGSPSDVERNAELAGRFRRDWFAFAKGEARLVDDRELTPTQIASYGLLCIGSPRTNRFLARVASRLPLRVTETGYEILGERIDHGGEPLGLLLCYPNPEAPEQLLVVMDGLVYGEHLPVNHKWDLVPDVLVFRRERGPRETNRSEFAAFFGPQWRRICLRSRTDGAATVPPAND